MPRHGVQYVANDEPSFIKNFKEKIGYKEGPSVNTKRQIPTFDSDEDEDAPVKEDETPVVVVLKDGDLTAEEAKTAQQEIDEGPARLDEKITFKKPSKHKPSDQGDGGSKTPSEDEPKKKKKKEKDTSSKQRQQKSLLSFGDEEEEES